MGSGKYTGIQAKVLAMRLISFVILCGTFFCFLIQPSIAKAQANPSNEFSLIWYDESDTDFVYATITDQSTSTLPFGVGHLLGVSAPLNIFGADGKLYFINSDGDRKLVHEINNFEPQTFMWFKEGVYEVDFFEVGIILSQSDNWWQRLARLMVPNVYAADGDYLTTIRFTILADGEIPVPNPTCDLVVSDESIERGQTTQMSWNSEYAESVTFTPSIGTTATSGAVNISPQATTTYTGVFSNETGSVECEVVVKVSEPVIKPLHEKAADLAKLLVNQPDAYLWGGKGWDYDEGVFTTSEKILFGYTYYNPTLKAKDMGIGVDCSGLIAWAFNRANDATKSAANNVVKYLNADGLFRDWQSDEVAESELRPGDTLSFDWDSNGSIDHVAMYVGESGGYDVVNSKSEVDGIVTEIQSVYSNLDAFQGYKRIHQANAELAIETGSPVDIEVTDPDGFNLTTSSIVSSDEEYIREIPGKLYYFELEQGHDGQPIDRVLAPVLKEGVYNIEVIPNPNTDPTDTYSLTITTLNEKIVVADNRIIGDIPEEGFSLTVAGDEVEILENETLTTDELFALLNATIKEAKIKPAFLKKRLLTNVEVAKYWYKQDKTQWSIIVLKNLKNLVKRKSDNGISIETSDQLVDIIDKLVTQIKP